MRVLQGESARARGVSEPAPKSVSANGMPPIYEAHERIQQEAGKSSRCGRALDLLLQFLPRSRSAAQYARNGAWSDGSHLDDWRVDCSGA